MSANPLISATQESVISLEDETRFAPQSIVSRTILNTNQSRVTLFGFAEGQELTEHTSTSAALVQILSGECDFALDGKWQRLRAGNLIYMPPNLPHALKAPVQFSMLLTLFKQKVVPGIPKLRPPSLLPAQGN